ncbi:hypothetical protein [Mesorhizobium marinum]|uniref:hypothetical protein n=1 Tax=Mesorhizobium marinum TaxID=3228790 RepID=UPI0034659D5F
MSDDVIKEENGRADLVDRLVKKTGITEAQASNLITVLGANWSSLVREARLLKRSR